MKLKLLNQCALVLAIGILIGCNPSEDNSSTSKSNTNSENSQIPSKDESSDKTEELDRPSDDENDSDKTIAQTNNWTPVRMEWYYTDGSLAACQRNELDANGYLLSSTYSHVSLDENHPVECKDTDLNLTFSEYFYSDDYLQFTTQSHSTYAPNLTCEKTYLTPKGVTLRTEYYTSSDNNYSCTTLNNKISSLLTTEMQEDYYDTKTIFRARAGNDNQWETEDDIIATLHKSTWSDDRLMKTTLNYISAGDDEIWDTEDDILTGALNAFYKADKVPDYTYRRSLNIDGTPNTESSGVREYTKYQYQDGKIASYTIYDTPGLDNIWETVEDNRKVLHVIY